MYVDDVEAYADRLQAVRDVFENILINGENNSAKIIVPSYALQAIIDEMRDDIDHERGQKTTDQ